MSSDLYRDLEIDTVLSEGQLLRHYGLNLSDLPADIHTFNAFLARTHHSMTYREFTFVTLEPTYKTLSASALRHLAGIAEMRRLFAVPRDRWQQVKADSNEYPDAVWHHQGGDIAVEYDAGAYSPTTLNRKILAFRAYSQQLWGSPSVKRVRHLQAFLADAGESAPPIYAPWD